MAPPVRAVRNTKGLPGTFGAAGDDNVEGRRELRAGALCSRRAHTGRTRRAYECCRRGCPHVSVSLPCAEPLLCAAGLAPLAFTPSAGACYGYMCRPYVRTGHRLREGPHAHKQGYPSNLMRPSSPRCKSPDGCCVYPGWLLCVRCGPRIYQERTCHLFASVLNASRSPGRRWDHIKKHQQLACDCQRLFCHWCENVGDGPAVALTHCLENRFRCVSV